MSRIKVSNNREFVSSTRRRAILRLLAIYKAMMNGKNKSEGISLVFASLESHLVDVPFGGSILRHHTCYQFITGTRKGTKSQSRKGDKKPIHWEWRKNNSWMDKKIDVRYWFFVWMLFASVRWNLIFLFQTWEITIYLLFWYLFVSVPHCW